MKVPYKSFIMMKETIDNSHHFSDISIKKKNPDLFAVTCSPLKAVTSFPWTAMARISLSGMTKP